MNIVYCLNLKLEKIYLRLGNRHGRIFFSYFGNLLGLDTNDITYGYYA